MSGQLIATKQNEPEQVKRLAAKKQLYLKENMVNGLQMFLAVVTALGGAVVQNFVKGSEPYVVIASGVIGVCDVIVFENLKGRWQQTAARIQEQFDCAVLDLPWRRLKTGPEPGPEATAEHCKKFYDNAKEQKKLIDWYPAVIKDLPMRPARILCQRENCLYDARLRETYITVIIVWLSVLTLLTLVIGVVLNHNFVESLAGMVAPLIPAYVIGLREIKQNKEALETAKRLYDHAEELWEKAINKSVSDQELDTCARFLKDEIFDNRRRSPVIFDWFYGMFRSKNEALLTESAEQLVKNYKQKNP
jgi:hypothetical protein